ncbi:hypothetical protein [Mastigocoleus testarum]|uniref:Uncharacterized protein n=1 Tax=Mastigocoleus testarum BC008 TaxID=371196 RepID=A0A0V7ZT40_9CYAN|nr:hypothetical protein [Mastigocoleus testarum]KST67538.1 hypothetical protein BC008_30540 [Mastigocoleus testarum BC008]KST69826.1 hypothetical protein BC008_36310 [Mastigocoleus testarum BC008]
MFSKKIFWKFAVGAVVIPGFLGLGVAQASVTKELDKQPSSQEINQNLINFTQTPDIQHLEVDSLSLEVEPELGIEPEVDSEELEQTKSNYHYKHHHHKKRRRHHYKKYRRPCRTRRYYRPKKVHYRKRRSRNYYHNNVNYRRYPRKRHNNYYYGY